MKIWYNIELYDLVSVFRPTKFDTYLLCQRIVDDEIHKDEKTNPIEMILIDVHNDEFVFDSPSVRRLVNTVKKEREQTSPAREKLINLWLYTSLEKVKKLPPQPLGEKII